MKFFAILIACLTSITAQAGLLNRIQIEDAIQSRVEHALQATDPDARAIVRLELKSYQGELPGSRMVVNKDFTPQQIDISDIQKVSIQIYSTFAVLPPELQTKMISLVPVDKNKVKIDLFEVKKTAPPAALPPINAQDLREIAENSIQTWIKMGLLGLAGTLLAGVLFMLFQESRRSRHLKEQVKILATAFSENSSSPAPLPGMASNTAVTPVASSMESQSESSEFQKFPVESLSELMADCYWTELDSYAHWIWKKLETNQQAQLSDAFPLLRQYAVYFVNLTPVAMSYHDHPYYLRPLKLQKVSQKDLQDEVRKDLGRWHLISPLRQEHLKLDLESKLKAVQSGISVQAWQPQFESEPRRLKTIIRWGELSREDELTILSNPEMVPDLFRSQIPSLAWLAQKDPQDIAKVLEKFDARSLAEAWIGPDEVLQKLETQIPEKKLKLLQTYRARTRSSRHSAAYIALVQEGLRDDAA